MIGLELARVLRRCRKAPRFSAIVIASIAIAIAPILVASSVFDATYLRNMAVKNSAQLVAIQSARISKRGSGATLRGISYPDYKDLGAALPKDSWRYKTAWKVKDVSRTTLGADQPLTLAAISDDYFRIADARFVQGYAPSDNEEGAVVSRVLWRELKASGDTAELRIYNQSFHIVGVVDESFRGLNPNEGVDAWIPLKAFSRVDGDLHLLSYRELEDLSAVIQTISKDAAPLLPTVTAMSSRLSEFHEGEREGWHFEITQAQPSFLTTLHTTKGQAALAPLLVLVCVLLIAATNVANLFVVRSAARVRDLQVRLALGISRRHLLLYECAEPILLGVAGLSVGIALGVFALRQLAENELFQRLRLELTASSLLAACAAALLFVGMCALMPAIQLRRLRGSDVIHQGQGITSHGATRLQQAYLVLQFTLALAFTCVAVQLASAVRQQSNVNLGFDLKNLMVVKGSRGEVGQTTDQNLAMYNRVAATVSAIPGVVAVSASMTEFFGGYRGTRRPITVNPDPTAETLDYESRAAMDGAKPGYLRSPRTSDSCGKRFSR